MKTGTLSKESQVQLNGYRAQIDEVDKQLIALLKERIKIVSNVSKLKHEDASLQCFIRSGRESEMLRDIYAQFVGTDFHPQAACAIWRMLISASTHHENAMRIITPSSLEPASKAYFGDFMPVLHTETAIEAINALAETPCALIIMPLWQDNPQYWQDFAKYIPDTLKVFAAIPFVGGKPKAFVAANLTPEPSSDDISIFIDKASGQIETIDGYHNNLASSDTKGHKQWLGTYGRPINGE